MLGLCIDVRSKLPDDIKVPDSRFSDGLTVLDVGFSPYYSGREDGLSEFLSHILPRSCEIKWECSPNCDSILDEVDRPSWQLRSEEEEAADGNFWTYVETNLERVEYYQRPRLLDRT